MIQQIPQDRPAKTVLIVEDNDDGLFMLRTLLQLKGYRVTEARDGLDAIEIAINDRPDLILTDLQLPRLDGISITRHLRHHPRTHNIPIVIASGYPPAGHRAVAIAAGCDEYLFKPFDFDLLDRILDRYLFTVTTTPGATQAAGS
ncbi:MAG TPA: response regulator [Pyrinomonadaceae bacterium]|jgi:CheY-like chemotaxis protein